MCGIAGIVVPDNARPDELRSALEKMRAAQDHRGPDDAGMYWDERSRVGLVNCRLSIRDLSPAGHMPMCAPDVCITYNGEIYNADALRTELAQLGHAFDSHSDTEVILRGYLQWRHEIVSRVRGMFAFAIFDAQSQSLLLARDPLGIKPLYYSQTAPFCFASEIRAFGAARLTSHVIDDVALSAYLQLGSIPAPHTIYRDIAALPPGHIAELRLEDGELQLRRYWSLREKTNTATVPDVKTALVEAVASHLVSDVPVGAFLSGGLDSSTVVALAMREASEAIRTCSIAFESAQYDESAYARTVAHALGTRHQERVVTRSDFMANMDGFMGALDQPSIDGFNTYFVAQTARDIGLKVALSGLGGDELFGGYPTFRGLPRLLRALKTSRTLTGAGAATAIGAFTRSDRWRKVAEAARRPANAATAYLVYRGLFTRTEAAQMLRAADPFDATAHVNERAGPLDVALPEWVSRAELGTYTASQLLRDSDVMSMAHSLELRVPLLDTHLVETISALPPSERFRGPGDKPLLREIMKGDLPAAVLNRRERQGFTFPLQEWLAADDAKALWQWDAPVMQYFRRSELSALQHRYRAGHTHWSRVWALIALNEWSRRVAHA